MQFQFHSRKYIATVKVLDKAERLSLTELGKYIAECLPKYVQKAQINGVNELEILIHPEGVIPVLTFLKENHRTQFQSFISVTAVDVLSRQYRFEVNLFFNLESNLYSKN
jgi:NADH dehydrogenase (ubiquinone) Fe-S protein 3